MHLAENWDATWKNIYPVRPIVDEYKATRWPLFWISRVKIKTSHLTLVPLYLTSAQIWYVTLLGNPLLLSNHWIKSELLSSPSRTWSLDIQLCICIWRVVKQSVIVSGPLAFLVFPLQNLIRNRQGWLNFGVGLFGPEIDFNSIIWWLLHWKLFLCCSCQQSDVFVRKKLSLRPLTLRFSLTVIRHIKQRYILLQHFFGFEMPPLAAIHINIFREGATSLRTGWRLAPWEEKGDPRGGRVFVGWIVGTVSASSVSTPAWVFFCWWRWRSVCYTAVSYR